MEKSRDAAEGSQADRAGSLFRAALLLNAVAAGGRAGASLPDLVQRTRLPRPTIHRVCHMLEETGWLERDGATGRFYLGADLALLGHVAQLHHPVADLVEPHLTELSRATGQTFYYVVRSGDDSVCLARVESTSLIRTLVLEVGSRQPLGIGAGSMALLAALPREEMDEVIVRNLERYRERATYDETLFRRSIELARERGFASHEALFTAGVSGIGVAVPDGQGYPLGAVSTAFVSSWMDAGQEGGCVRAMENAAAAISRSLLVGQSRKT